MTTTQTSNTRSKSKSSGTETATRSMDALALLKADHRKVEELFSEFEGARRADQKARIVKQICLELTVHAALEEQEFYPVAREALDDDEDLVDEANVEHASLKWLIAQLEGATPDTELYAAKVTVLKEYVQHHVKEEEKEMFPKLKKTELDLKALGEKMAETKVELMKSTQAH
jgi:hemerythrin superfamily protein